MTSWILSIALLLTTGVGIGDLLRDQDRDQDRDPIQQQLHDGSCQTASVAIQSGLNV